MSAPAREVRTRRAQKKATAQAAKQARIESIREAFEKANVKFSCPSTVAFTSPTATTSTITVTTSPSARLSVATPKAGSLAYSEKNGQKLAQPIDESMSSISLVLYLLFPKDFML